MENFNHDLLTALENLKSVLCDPEGRVCVHGSEEDRSIIEGSLKSIHDSLRHYHKSLEAETASYECARCGRHLTSDLHYRVGE